MYEKSQQEHDENLHKVLPGTSQVRIKLSPKAVLKRTVVFDHRVSVEGIAALPSRVYGVLNSEVPPESAKLKVLQSRRPFHVFFAKVLLSSGPPSFRRRKFPED